MAHCAALSTWKRGSLRSLGAVQNLEPVCQNLTAQRPARERILWRTPPFRLSYFSEMASMDMHFVVSFLLVAFICCSAGGAKGSDGKTGSQAVRCLCADGARGQRKRFRDTLCSLSSRWDMSGACLICACVDESLASAGPCLTPSMQA